MRSWRAWASVVNDGGPGADRICVIDTDRARVRRPFAKTIRVLIVEIPRRRRRRR